MLALRTLVSDVSSKKTALYKEMKNIPNDRIRNFRNDMYLISEALRLMQRSGKPQISAADAAVLANYKKHIDHSTRFIPLWVKVAVAMALGLGTMVGWKRIVVTVGEKIGKSHLTYAQGAVAEITAMATIGAADGFGLPVSTTRMLSSGIAGTIARQPFRDPMVHRPQPGTSLGPDPPSSHDALRFPILDLPPSLLGILGILRSSGAPSTGLHR